MKGILNTNGVFSNSPGLDRLLRNHWRSRVSHFMQQTSDIINNNIVLLGDSLTEHFPVNELLPDFNIINRGIKGDVIGGANRKGLADRIRESFFNLNPGRVFTMIGINDIIFSHTQTADIIAGYHRLFSKFKFHRPDSIFFVQSLLPTCGIFSEFNKKISALNKTLKHITENYNFTFIDLHSELCDNNFELSENLTIDGLHLNHAGYRKWSRILLNYCNTGE